MAEGYRAHLSLTPEQEAAFLDQHCEYAFGRERDGATVELHWEIVPPEFGLPVDGWRLWDDLRPISLLGCQALSPPAEDLLVILCAHGSKHLWNRLGWVCDVAELIRAHPGLDWTRALGRARALGAERMVRLGLILAAQLMEVELPARVQVQIAADRRTRGLAARIAHWVASGTLPPERSFREARVHLAARAPPTSRYARARVLSHRGLEAVPRRARPSVRRPAASAILALARKAGEGGWSCPAVPAPQGGSARRRARAAFVAAAHALCPAGRPVDAAPFEDPRGGVSECFRILDRPTPIPRLLKVGGGGLAVPTVTSFSMDGLSVPGSA
jgi:hypothetical protein